MKKVAVILSGCGVFDGTEIQEAVSTLIALDQTGTEYQCLAPNKNQAQTINHLTNKSTNESRNVLVEAARIARGNILDLNTANASDYAAAIYPGGFGAATNLSTFATDGANMTLDSDVLNFANAMKKAKKPQGFICISPTLISKIYGPGVTQTIGNDAETKQVILDMGGKHIDCPVDEVSIDETHHVVSTPAYMLAKGPAEIFQGVSKLVSAVLSMTK